MERSNFELCRPMVYAGSFVPFGRGVKMASFVIVVAVVVDVNATASRALACGERVFGMIYS